MEAAEAVEGRIGNNDGVATAASMKRRLPHEHNPLLTQSEPGASDRSAEESELTRIGEGLERDVIRPRGAMLDMEGMAQWIIFFSRQLRVNYDNDFLADCSITRKRILLDVKII